MGMRVAYANARFRADSHDGANAHVRQFVQNAVALGHELWMWPGVTHPQAQALPSQRLARTLKLREMDVLYVRVEHDLPNACTWSLGPTRSLIGNPPDGSVLTSPASRSSNEPPSVSAAMRSRAPMRKAYRHFGHTRPARSTSAR